MYVCTHNHISNNRWLISYYPLIQRVNSSKTSHSLHPPSSLRTVKSPSPSQPLHSPFCPHTFNYSKPSQPLLPPSCPPPTSKQTQTTSVSRTPSQFSNQQSHDQSPSFRSSQQCLIQKWPASDSRKCKKCTNRSVLFCSNLAADSVKQIANDLCKYTAGSSN